MLAQLLFLFIFSSIFIQFNFTFKTKV